MLPTKRRARDANTQSCQRKRSRSLAAPVPGFRAPRVSGPVHPRRHASYRFSIAAKQERSPRIVTHDTHSMHQSRMMGVRVCGVHENLYTMTATALPAEHAPSSAGRLARSAPAETPKSLASNLFYWH